MTGKPWGRAVKLPKGSAATGAIEAAAPLRKVGCEAVRQMSEGQALVKWRALGITTPGGAPVAASESVASLYRAGAQSYLLNDNYSVLLQYNCAHAYALAVGLLADRIGTR